MRSSVSTLSRSRCHLLHTHKQAITPKPQRMTIKHKDIDSSLTLGMSCRMDNQTQTTHSPWALADNTHRQHTHPGYELSNGHDPSSHVVVVVGPDELFLLACRAYVSVCVCGVCYMDRERCCVGVVLQTHAISRSKCWMRTRTFVPGRRQREHKRSTLRPGLHLHL